MSIENLNINRGYSEVKPFDDYKDRFSGFSNKTPFRDEKDIKKWANDTSDYARKGFYFYCLETPLKLVRHFVDGSDYKGTMVANLVYSGERLFGMLGDVCRNLIYGHRDSKGNLDDNLGAQDHGKNESGKGNISIGKINYHSQTGGKLLLVGLGLYDSELANDIEWSVVNNLDKWWWTSMGTDIAFGPDFFNKCLNSLQGIFKSKTNEDSSEIPLKQYVADTFKGHIENTKNSWSKFSNSSNKEEKDKNLLSFCENADKTVSSFAPIVNTLSVLANVTRPFARRLELSGFSRDIIRVLSVVSKPYSCLTNIFRFYIPEKFTRKNDNPLDNKHKMFGFLDSADMLLASTIGNTTDFVSVVFESAVKESSGNIRHLLEVSRTLSKSFEEGYFCLRRMYPVHDMELQEKKSMYEKLQEIENN